MRAAVEALIDHGFVSCQRKDDLVIKALAVEVSADLGKTRGCALLGAEEEIVGVEYVATVDLAKDLRERRFTACAAAFDGYDSVSSEKQLVDLGEKREKIRVSVRG